MERSPNTVKACSHDLRDWVEFLDQQRPAQRPTHPSTPPGDEVRFASASFAHLIMPRPSRESWAIPPKRFDKASSPTSMTANQPPCWQRQIAAHGPRGRDHAAVVPAKQTRLHISELLGLDCGESYSEPVHTFAAKATDKLRSVPMTDPVHRRSVV